MKNKIEDVRNLLIEGMERLLHPEANETFGVEQAKAMAALGKVVVESAKAETQHLKVVLDLGLGKEGTGFINVNKKLTDTTN